MRGRDVEGQVCHEPRQSGRLAFGELQNEPRQGGGVDDRMLEWALQAATDEPGVERVVAVLNQDRALSKAKEGSARVAKLRCADEHGTVDVMAPVGIWVDGRLAVHQRVEERKRPIEPEALRADLQHEEGRVSGRLHVEGDELRLAKPCLGADFGSVDRDLFPGDRFHGPARLEKNRSGAHRASARARRAQSISSRVTPRMSRTAPP